MTDKPPQFHGGCMGVDLKPRNAKDPHLMLVISTEDDGNWFEKMNVDSAWLDELIAKLQEARKYCETQTPAMGGCFECGREVEAHPNGWCVGQPTKYRGRQYGWDAKKEST